MGKSKIIDFINFYFVESPNIQKCAVPSLLLLALFLKKILFLWVINFSLNYLHIYLIYLYAKYRSMYVYVYPLPIALAFIFISCFYVCQECNFNGVSVYLSKIDSIIENQFPLQGFQHFGWNTPQFIMIGWHPRIKKRINYLSCLEWKRGGG